jgi:hypothetical protein
VDIAWNIHPFHKFAAQAAKMIDWRTRPVAEAEPIGLLA